MPLSTSYRSPTGVRRGVRTPSQGSQRAASHTRPAGADLTDPTSYRSRSYRRAEGGAHPFAGLAAASAPRLADARLRPFYGAQVSHLAYQNPLRTPLQGG